MKGEAVRATAIYPQEESAWMCLGSMYKYLMEKVKKTEKMGPN